MLATWSIRTYRILEHYHLAEAIETPEQAIGIADLIVKGLLPRANYHTAIELYRAACLGIYLIEKKLDYKIDLFTIEMKCNYLDNYIFHYDMRGLN